MIGNDDDVQCLFNYPTQTLWVVNRVACACSGTLSILGSSLIIYIILSGKIEQRKRMHNHLLICLSAFDIVYSLGWSLSTLPVPRDSKCTSGAFGNHGTCALQGLMLNFGIAVPHYNVVLCLYFVAVIRYNVSDATLKKFEPYMHVFGVATCVLSSIYFLATDRFHSRQGFCWVEDKCRYSDESCREEWEQSKDVSRLSAFIYVLYTSLLFLIVVLSMLLLFWTVWDQERTMSRYQFGNSRRSSQIRSDTSDTAKQATLYVLGFLVSHSMAIVICIMDLSGYTKQNSVMGILMSICQPLQGFMNFLTFIRPRYCAVRLKYPDEKISSIFSMILFQMETTGRSSHYSTTRLSHLKSSRQGKNAEIQKNSSQQNSKNNIENENDDIVVLDDFENEKLICQVNDDLELTNNISEETFGKCSLQEHKEQLYCSTIDEILSLDVTPVPLATPRQKRKFSLPTSFLETPFQNKNFKRKSII